MRRHFFREHAQIDDVHRGFRQPRFRARHRQQPIDEIRQSIGLFEHAADRRAVRGFVVAIAQRHFADAAHRRQRRSQLVRNVGREPAHLRERRFEPAEHLVDHEREPSELVPRVVDRQAIAQPIGGNRASALRDAIDGSERAPRERVPADAGGEHRERQTEQQRDDQIANRPPHARFRSRHLQHDGTSGNLRMSAQDAKGNRPRRHDHDPVVRAPRQIAARRNRLSLGDRRAVQELAVGAPDLQPRALLVVARRPLEPRQRSVRLLFRHFGRPAEVAAQTVVERSRGALVHEPEQASGVDREDNDHRGRVPEREPKSDARLRHASPGSPSRSMKPTPRTV